MSLTQTVWSKVCIRPMKLHSAQTDDDVAFIEQELHNTGHGFRVQDFRINQRPGTVASRKLMCHVLEASLPDTDLLRLPPMPFQFHYLSGQSCPAFCCTAVKCGQHHICTKQSGSCYTNPGIVPGTSVQWHKRHWNEAGKSNESQCRSAIVTKEVTSWGARP